MPSNPIEDILADRRNKSAPEDETDPNKFYSVLSAEGYQENFLEIRFRDGLRTCFAYPDLNWFNHDPDEGTLDLEFGGFLVTLVGRGLGDRLFHAIKSKRAAWVKEADSDFQDNSDNEVYIEKILISPPQGFGESEEEENE
ncbi:MAG: hypothetical protein CMO55_17085 [Verrucomicrobiales bacterium]|nr:hypothetical protein [Verrucomicrobiales bacterium]